MLEHADQGNLEEFRENKDQLSKYEIAIILEQLLLALNSLHEHESIHVHRDFKLQNVLVFSDLRKD